MKRFIKTALATGLIALSCTCTSLAATTAASLGAEIGQKGGFYTLYLGMPVSDFHENWDGISGWKHNRGSNYKDMWLDNFERSYKLEGKTVLENLSVMTDEKRGYVRTFRWKISSSSRDVIEKVFVNIYDRLASCYPGFTDRIPRGYTYINGHKPFMYLDSQRDESLGLYLAHGYGADPKYPNYYISLGYEKK